MRNIFTIILLGLFFCPICLQGQTKKKPRPDWVFEQPTPNSNNKTMDYYVGIGYGSTPSEAANRANADALHKAASRIGVKISSEDLHKAEQSGDYLKILTAQFTIRIKYQIYEYEEQISEDYYKVYSLCQAGVSANVIPEWEHYTETFIKINELKSKREQQKKKMNAKALVASTFIPGMGQMMKKQGGSGAAFLLSELAVFGGGTACYFLGQEQVKTMKAVGTSYESYKSAKNMKNIYDIAMYACFGVGAAVHIGNMVHAWRVEDKNPPASAAFIPAIIPVNDYSTPTYAFGAGVQITF